MAHTTQTLIERLSQEREELSVKATKLSAFILDDPAYKELTPAYRYARISSTRRSVCTSTPLINAWNW